MVEYILGSGSMCRETGRISRIRFEDHRATHRVCWLVVSKEPPKVTQRTLGDYRTGKDVENGLGGGDPLEG